ncbi:MAG: homoserine dehydrogenase, partial [Thermoplasmata archaeon]|nr:homoserine dehydrogenase [Thermoplasmata archaeon]
MQKIALIGCGVVGQGLLKILRDKEEFLRDRYGFEIQLVAVSDKMKGSLMAENGIPLASFIDHLEAKKNIEEFKVDGATYGLDPLETIKRTSADTIVEVSFTDVKTGEPASTYFREAFKAGKNVATTNKGPSALFHRELAKLAEENGAFFKYEGTVMSGTPIFSLLDYALAGNKVTGVRGILNGTTNFILCKMESEGMPYQEALEMAQKLGYAEADPTADVEGFDAMAKVLILS